MDREPYIWEFKEDGIRRQVKIHIADDGSSVQWDPRYPGDELPWFNGNGEWERDAYRYEDADLVTLGMPATRVDSFDY